MKAVTGDHGAIFVSNSPYNKRTIKSALCPIYPFYPWSGFKVDHEAAGGRTLMRKGIVGLFTFLIAARQQ
jgi:hypothetical protein